MAAENMRRDPKYGSLGDYNHIHEEEAQWKKGKDHEGDATHKRQRAMADRRKRNKGR